MKRYVLFLFFIAAPTIAFCQTRNIEEQKIAQLVESRVESLIKTKKYKWLTDKIVKDTLIRVGTIISAASAVSDTDRHFTPKNIAEYQLGKMTKENSKGFIILYTIRYGIKEDKIISVTKGDK